MTNLFRSKGLIAMALFLLTIATRGSHVGSAALLPDATLAAMLLGGMLLHRAAWFAALMACCVAVDAFAVGVAGVSSYCLSPAYWALLPTYAVMWLGGLWLYKYGRSFDLSAFLPVAIVTTTVAFMISTDSFYLFSGHYPRAKLAEVLLQGWQYFPSYLGYTLMYLSAAWALQFALRTLSVARASRSA